MESDHSHTAYRIRMPQPQAAYAYRVYGILDLDYIYSGSSMRYALSGKNGKACKRVRVIPYVRILMNRSM